jgi:transposase
VRHDDDGDGPNAKEARSVEVLIGVDPHKATNVVAAIDEQGELVGQQTFPANRKGLRALQRWAKRFPERRWAVEGAGGIGRPLAQKLLAAGERVVEVPPKLSSRVRVLSTGNARKNDGLDATFTALAALRNHRLSSVQPEDGPEGHAEILRLLTERREHLVSERTRALNRLHVLLRDLLSDPVRKQLSTDAAAKLLRRPRPKHPAGRVRRRLASEVVRDVRALDRRIAGLDERIAGEVEASGHHAHRDFRRRADSSSEDHGDSRRRFALPEQGALRFLRRCGTNRSFQRRGSQAQALPCRQPQAQPGHAHDRRLPGSQRSSWRSVSSEEAGGGQVAQGGDALPQAAHLGHGVQGAGRGFAARFANGPLTQRGLEKLSEKGLEQPLEPPLLALRAAK